MTFPEAKASTLSLSHAPQAAPACSWSLVTSASELWLGDLVGLD
ncbi:MAG: hypothetical protein ABI725_07670 [Chloroflexota bacterium]